MEFKQAVIIKGDRKILLSAPHAFLHPRKTFEGIQMRVGETLTDSLMRDVCAQSSSFGICLDSQPDYDPNFDKYSDNPYKHTVRNLIHDFKINYFIDLHGLNNSHPFDVAIYFRRKYENSKQFAFKIAKDLDNSDLHDSLLTVPYFKNNGQETLAEFVCSNLKIPAVQIEIAWYLLEDDKLRNCLTKLLSQSISSLF